MAMNCDPACHYGLRIYNPLYAVLFQTGDKNLWSVYYRRSGLRDRGLVSPEIRIRLTAGRLGVLLAQHLLVLGFRGGRRFHILHLVWQPFSSAFFSSLVSPFRRF